MQIELKGRAKLFIFILDIRSCPTTEMSDANNCILPEYAREKIHQNNKN